MRLRILITVASIISLSLPAYTTATVAASPGRTAAPLRRVAMAPRDTAVEAALLRSLMVERHDLIQRLLAPNAERGRLLTQAILGAADAVLSGDAASLRRVIDAASTAAQRRRRAAVQTVLWLTPASPGALWSPSSRALAPGPLAWALPATAASPV